MFGSKTEKKLSTRQSSERSIASDSELDCILHDVEKMEKNNGTNRKVLSSEPVQAEQMFSKEDEQMLTQIFDNVEKRKREFEELRVAVSQSCDIENEDRDSISSTSSKSSKNSDFEKMIDEIESQNNDTKSDDSSSIASDSDDSNSGSDDNSSDDEDSSESDEEKVEKSLQNSGKRKHTTSTTDKTKHPSMEEGTKTVYHHKKSQGKRLETLKSQKTSHSKSKAVPNSKSDEELDSMVSDLLEF